VYVRNEQSVTDHAGKTLW